MQQRSSKWHFTDNRLCDRENIFFPVPFPCLGILLKRIIVCLYIVRGKDLGQMLNVLLLNRWACIIRGWAVLWLWVMWPCSCILVRVTWQLIQSKWSINHVRAGVGAGILGVMGRARGTQSRCAWAEVIPEETAGRHLPPSGRVACYCVMIVWLQAIVGLSPASEWLTLEIGVVLPTYEKGFIWEISKCILSCECSPDLSRPTSHRSKMFVCRSTANMCHC